MKRNVRFLVLLSLLGFTTSLLAQVNTNTTITWPFDLGTAGQTATYTEGTADYFKPDHVAVGSNLAYKDAREVDNLYTRFQPAAQLGSPSADCLISFNVWPVTGLSFAPTSIAFDCMRFGTDGGSVDIIWKASDGTSTTLGTGIKPERDKVGTGTHVSYDLSTLSIPASDGECSLEIYVYALGDTKQAGIADVVIQGAITGTIVQVNTYTVAATVSPSEAGTITSYPVGDTFDEGTEVTLTASKNFGYAFSHWEDGTGSNVSSNAAYTFTLNSDVTLKAVFDQVNTYVLDLAVDGGGKDYMVTISPEGTMVDEARMYEEGTTVTLTASGNPVMTFTNWDSGETSADLMLNMTEDKTVTALYSAADFVVGWDFIRSGNSGRVADFYSKDENQSSALILRDADGTAKSWLDKSQEAAGGYEGQPAAVNWNPIAEKYYYQISFDASEFTDLVVAADMLFNYNAYAIQNVEYSTDGETFSALGTITLTSAKAWTSGSFALPIEANHAAKVYIRWIPDYTSDIVGSTATNDGTGISAIYVTGKAKILNDGTAPVLVSSVPVKGATGASATGKIVLTFDEKVECSKSAMATLGDKTLYPTVTGKTLTFDYTGLDYGTAYTFTFAKDQVSDLGGNTLITAITIDFTTMTRPTVSKKTFDFIVGKDGDFAAALTAAEAAKASGKRFYIFFPNGEYNIGEITGDANQMTTVSIPNVSYVGESADGVIIYNKSINESINSTATLYFTSASDNIYMQDISLMNKMDYRTGSLKGRGVALWDQGDKNIYKNIKLLSNQDTYYTGGDRSYLETCEIHGTVDFICGGGDIFFNRCLIYLEERSGNVITAPATGGDWGYVFSNCTIDGFAINNGGYRLGRPWSNAPKAAFINTTMKVLPTAAGWGDPMNVVPAVFAEYNSTTASGAAVDLSSRRTTYTKDATTVTLNPVLTKTEADQYTIENVCGGNDAWMPQLHTEQAPTPQLVGTESELTWDDSDYVLCWAVFKDGTFLSFVTTNSYLLPETVAPNTEFTVRAANEMGGLSTVSNTYIYGATGVETTAYSSEITEVQHFTTEGKAIDSGLRYNGVIIVRTVYADGHIEVTKTINKTH